MSRKDIFYRSVQTRQLIPGKIRIVDGTGCDYRCAHFFAEVGGYVQNSYCGDECQLCKFTLKISRLCSLKKRLYKTVMINTY
jgi:hypothetical protein